MRGRNNERRGFHWTRKEEGRQDDREASTGSFGDSFTSEVKMGAKFLTETEVADRTKISLGTLRRWRLENRGPLFHKFGSLVRYPEDELAHWESAQPVGGGTATRIGPSSSRPLNQLRKSG
jgi:excisionase family DNA binding protein